MTSRHRLLVVASIALLLTACGSAPKNKIAPAPGTATAGSGNPVSSGSGKPAPALPKAGSGRGAYYKDDGPGDNPPPGLELTLDAEPKVEPYSSSGNKPYVVFGKTYTPMLDDKPFTQRGIGSWYGKKFNGQKTSSGELYDMYKMTAAHPTLPIPSYARVTNLSNGKQVIVKINDRGPFHTNRIVDLSYTAALKLDYLGKGSTELLLERLLPADIEKMAENRKNQPAPVQVAAAQITTVETMPVTSSVTQVASLAVTHAPATTVTASDHADTTGFESLVAHQATPDPVAPPVVPALAPSAVPSSAPSLLSSPVPPPPAVTSAPSQVGGIYLQFGAFGLKANAEATFQRLEERLAQLPAFEIVQQGTLYRLFSGPFSNRDAASDAIALALKIGLPKPIIVER